MCGRFSLGLVVSPCGSLYYPFKYVMQRSRIVQSVAHAYPSVQVREWINEDQFYPRHNIAPRSQSPVIRRADTPGNGDSPTNDELVMQTMKWGLVPHWSKHEDKTLSTTNARSENLVEGGGMWGSIKGSKRCVIPCEG